VFSSVDFYFYFLTNTLGVLGARSLIMLAGILLPAECNLFFNMFTFFEERCCASRSPHCKLTMGTIGGDLQPDCLTGPLLTVLGKPKISL